MLSNSPRQEKGIALVHLLVILSASVFLLAFANIDKRASSDQNLASLTSARVSFALNEAHTYFKDNGRWHYDSLCQSDSLITDKNSLKTGWGGDFTYECESNGSEYSVNYQVPNERVAYFVGSFPGTEVGGTVDGWTGLKSSIDRNAKISTENTKYIEIVESVLFENKSGETSAVVESENCDNSGESNWIPSISGFCAKSKIIRGWRVQSENLGSNKRKYSLEVKRDTYHFLDLLHVFPIYKWRKSDVACGDDDDDDDDDSASEEIPLSVSVLIQCEKP
ncbi:hypothetical protein A9Q99_13825 [Gammaproteobacteria bacterium 45_16_T64]|nr:hypothetical protein A9Q99_13825 [Gammaproteobacteria bacterium 45_16_T64]